MPERLLMNTRSEEFFSLVPTPCVTPSPCTAPRGAEFAAEPAASDGNCIRGFFCAISMECAAALLFATIAHIWHFLH
jgi:hypothetical protein